MLSSLSLFVALVTGGASSIRGQERDTTVLDPIIVTATRLSTPRTAVVASVSVMSGDEMRAQGVGTMGQALRMVPGLTVAETGSNGSTTSLFMRGGESDYVKVLVDGVPVNQPGGGYDFADLALVNIDRIEIVRGPTSVLYGTDALAGVIQVFTKRERRKPRIETGIKGGTHSSLEVDAAAVGGNDRLSFGAGLLRSTTRGIYEYNSDYDNLVLSGSASAAPDARTDVTVSARFGSSEFHYPTDGSGNLVDRNAYQVRDQLSGSLHLSRYVLPSVEGRMMLTLHRSVGGIRDEPDDIADTLGFFSYTSDGTVTRAGADVGAHVHLSSRSVISSGVQVERQSEQSTSESWSEFGVSLDSLDVERVTRGYYAQLQLESGRLGALNAGLRLDDSEYFGTFFTYRLGATARIGSVGLVRGSLGRGFKEPSFYENFANNPFAVGNPALKPERSAMWELGVERKVVGLGAVLAATYFDQRYTDLIQYDAAPLGVGQPNYVNLASASSSGLELEVRIAASPRFAVSAGYTYLRTEVTDAGVDTDADAGFVEGQRLLRRPRHRGGVNARYSWRGWGLLAANLDYVGGRDDRDFSTYPATRVELPAYLKLDVAGEITLMHRQGGRPEVKLTARIDNVLDSEYQEVVGFPARGRVIFVGGRLGN